MSYTIKYPLQLLSPYVIALINEDTLSNVFEYFGDAFLELERKVLRMKHIDYMENKDMHLCFWGFD